MLSVVVLGVVFYIDVLTVNMLTIITLIVSMSSVAFYIMLSVAKLFPIMLTV